MRLTIKRSQMTAKQYKKGVKLYQSASFKRAMRVNMNRVIREVTNKRMAELEEKRQETMSNGQSNDRPMPLDPSERA